MIIVEGPDGAGKTTFVEKLADHFEMDVAEKAVGHDMEEIKPIQAYVEETLAQGFQSKIYDRFALISGCIYDPVFTGMEGINRDFRAFDWLHSMQVKLLFEIDPIVIWCLPPLHTVLNNLRGDHLNKAVNAQLDRVRAVYWLYHCRAAIEPEAIIYDYTTDDVHAVFADIEIALEDRDAE